MRRVVGKGCVIPALLLAACGDAPRVNIDEPWTGVTVPVALPVLWRASATGLDGPAAALAWRFGDAARDSGATARHAFGGVGNYTVSVSAGTDAGLEARRAVTVVDAPPPGNYAIRLDGTGRNDQDRVKILVDDPGTSHPGPPVDVGATDFTIEFWVRADSGANAAGPVKCGANANWINGNVVLDRDRYSQGRKYGLSLGAGRPVFGVTASGSDERTICGATRLDDGRWHHIAVSRVRGTGALALYIDGRLEASSAGGPAGDISYPDNGKPGNHCGGPCLRSDPFLVLGAEKHDAGPSYPSFRGDIDELRISDTLRYSGPFTPPANRFEPDGRTAALYHFDEGAGNLARDLSERTGGPSHGILMTSPTGPAWVQSGAPTGNNTP